MDITTHTVAFRRFQREFKLGRETGDPNLHCGECGFCCQSVIVLNTICNDVLQVCFGRL